MAYTALRSLYTHIRLVSMAYFNSTAMIFNNTDYGLRLYVCLSSTPSIWVQDLRKFATVKYAPG